MSDTDLHSLSVDQLNEAFRAKQLSPVEATEAALARIDACNDAVNAFVVVDREAAMASAKLA
ncbi:MAG: amidase, partial [Alphaproteobacteria bacterium]|nr:amidase [Alphaproteobacteria bacterium]